MRNLRFFTVLTQDFRQKNVGITATIRKPLPYIMYGCIPSIILAAPAAIGRRIVGVAVGRFGRSFHTQNDIQIKYITSNEINFEGGCHGCVISSKVRQSKHVLFTTAHA